MSERTHHTPSLQEAIESMASCSESGLMRAVALRRAYIDGDTLETIAHDFATDSGEVERLLEDGLRELMTKLNLPSSRDMRRRHDAV